MPSTSGIDTTVGSAPDTVTSLLVKARPAIVPAMGAQHSYRTVDIHLLQAPQGVVGHEQSPRLRPQDVTDNVYESGRLSGHETCGCIQHPADTSFGVHFARTRRIVDLGSRPSTRRRPYRRRAGPLSDRERVETDVRSVAALGRRANLARCSGS